MSSHLTPLSILRVERVSRCFFPRNASRLLDLLVSTALAALSGDCVESMIFKRSSRGVRYHVSLNILCDAIAFWYGPAAALSTLTDELIKRNGTSFTFHVLATGSTSELLERNNPRPSLIDIDSEGPKALAKLDLSEYDAFIDVCNPVSYMQLRSRHLRTAYVDFLLWMHEGPPSPHFEADLYLAENYPGTEQWVGHRAAQISNLRVVPPIIRPAQYRPTGGTLLVGLGGLVSGLTPLNAATDYRPSTLEEAYAIRLRALTCRMQRCLSVPRTEAPVYVLKEAAILKPRYSRDNAMAAWIQAPSAEDFYCARRVGFGDRVARSHRKGAWLGSGDTKLQTDRRVDLTVEPRKRSACRAKS